MISAKIILKSATKLTLNERFGEIAKQAPPPPRIEQQTSVIIPKSRRDLFGNRPSAALSTANRLKKRSINYRLGLGNNAGGGAAAPFNQQYMAPKPSHIFQRLSYGNRRRGGGANSYIFGGQSGLGLRIRGQGRVGTRIFHSRTRGFSNNNNNNAVNRFSGYSKRGNINYKNNNNNNNNNNYRNNNRGRRFGNKPNRGRFGGNKNFARGRGNGRNQNQRNNNNNNNNITKERLDNDIESYMAKASIDNSSIDMNPV